MSAMGQAYYAHYQSNADGVFCCAHTSASSPSSTCNAQATSSAASHASNIEVVHTASVGKILRATHPVRQGDVVFMEEPLLSFRHLNTPASVISNTCANCWRSVQSVQAQYHTIQQEAQEKLNRKNKKSGAASKSKKKSADETTASDQSASSTAADTIVDFPVDLPLISTTPFTSSPSSIVDPLLLPPVPPQPLPCPLSPSKCKAQFCSATCLEASLSRDHTLLCGAKELEKFSKSENEIFFLASQGIAHVLMKAAKGIKENQSRWDSILQDAGVQQLASDPLVYALQLFFAREKLGEADNEVLKSIAEQAAYAHRRFYSHVWWEHVNPPDELLQQWEEDAEFEAEEEEVEESEKQTMNGGRKQTAAEKEWRTNLCGVVEQALELLRAHLTSRFTSLLSSASVDMSASEFQLDEFLSALQWDSIVSMDLFGHLLSSFELNNIGMHAPTTLGLYYAKLLEFKQQGTSEQFSTTVPDVIRNALEGYEQQQQSSPEAAEKLYSSQGMGLFVFGCCMNHSCSPNVTMMDKKLLESQHFLQQHSGFAPASSSSSSSSSAPSARTIRFNKVAVFVALRDIEAGEELNISYIDLLQPGDDGETAEEVGREERQRQLKAYQFTCACQKCEREKND